MKILAVHAGGFPRIGDTHEQQRLRAAQKSLASWDSASPLGGTLPEEKFADIQNDMVREVLSVQAKAGLDLVSDGQIRWHDPVSHIMGKLEGVRLGGLRRYFDTNTYIRQPQATGPISAAGPLIAGEFRFARAISPRPVLAYLTGPFTLSYLSLPGGPYQRSADMMPALVSILAGEVEQLAVAGAGNIIIDESALSLEPGALPMVEDALEVLGGRKGAARLWLRLSFGDFAPLYEALQKLPVDGLILDFTYSPRLAEAVASSGSDLALGLGLVDARSIRLENPLKTAREAERLLKRVHGGEAWLVASNGVDFLPRNRAVEKLALLAKMRDFLSGKAGRKSASKKSGPAKRGKKARRAGKVRRAVRKPRRSPSAGRRRR